jgi:hypothetical protein
MGLKEEILEPSLEGWMFDLQRNNVKKSTKTRMGGVLWEQPHSARGERRWQRTKLKGWARWYRRT